MNNREFWCEEGRRKDREEVSQQNKHQKMPIRSNYREFKESKAVKGAGEWCGNSI